MSFCAWQFKEGKNDEIMKSFVGESLNQCAIKKSGKNVRWIVPWRANTIESFKTLILNVCQVVLEEKKLSRN